MFISFEGGDGTGKSTQCQRLIEKMTDEGYRVKLVREPGGTDVGEHLRYLLKESGKPITSETELLLFLAARSELVRKVIRPNLDTGVIIIADRYADSTVAYQGYGRQLSLQMVRTANELATAGVWPDLTVLLDGEAELGLSRASARGATLTDQRFEGEGVEFHQRVRKAFLNLAVEEPGRWVILDASQTEESLSDQIWELVRAHLGS